MVEVWKDRHVEENGQWWASYHQVSWHTWEQRMGFCKQLYKGVVHWQPDRISELPVQTHKSELPENWKNSLTVHYMIMRNSGGYSETFRPPPSIMNGSH
jgi:hypothetical protein